MDDLFAFMDANLTFTKFSGFGKDVAHKEVMSLEKVLHGSWVPGGEGFVGADSSLDFGNFARGTENSFAFNNGGNLVEGEAVAFDGESTLNSTDAILFAKLGGGLSEGVT
ncbi:hypothetical protein RIVM261_001680 [Rivularia sp. IAM M-261]|nr:hypothetical protein CAL7716_054280 [Calothrix sp. PCC 7716]GJD15212.1 hypothetical protein RIVM261_001680 [Rivularia sp. IAM M-261]